MIDKGKLDYIKSKSIFKKLSMQHVESLMQDALIHLCSKDEVIYFEGDQANKIYIVLSGYIKLCTRTVSGKEFIIKVNSADSLMGEEALLENSSYTYTAESASSSQVLELDAKLFRKKIMSDLLVSMTVLEEIINNQRAIEDQFECLSLMNASQRVAKYFLNFSTINTKNEITLNLKFEKSLIAKFLGMKPETFSRSLKKLQHLKVFVHGGEVVIKDVDLLQKFCAGNEHEVMIN